MIVMWCYRAVSFALYFQFHPRWFRMINESLLTSKPSHDQFLTFRQKVIEISECKLLQRTSWILSSWHHIDQCWLLTVVQWITVWATSSKGKNSFLLSYVHNDYCQMHFMLSSLSYLLMYLDIFKIFNFPPTLMSPSDLFHIVFFIWFSKSSYDNHMLLSDS